jgi:hypothetical protein
MSMPRRAVVLCEGYYDRSFWKGWLVHGLGCRSLDPRGPLKDPWGKNVGQGHFGFYSSSETLFIRVVPCNGDNKLLPTARRYLESLGTEPLAHLVLNVDVDTSTAGAARAVEMVRTLVSEVSSTAQRDEAGDFILGASATRVSPVAWYLDRPERAGVPNTQTLERLVCTALYEAYPERAAAVASWLSARPDPSTEAQAKAHAWSYMAGWYAEHGCSDFYEGVWRDPRLAQVLRRYLEDSRAWRVAAMLAA